MMHHCEAMPEKTYSATELLLSEFPTGKNRILMEQIQTYRRTLDIYERSQLALGRRLAYKATKNSTDKVKVNLNGIKSTNKI